MTISGSGFGNQADLGAPAPASGCSNTNTGSDYDNFSFSDVTAGWLAGGGNNCIGVSVSSYSSTQIVVTFGNGYGNGYGNNQYGALGYGDSLQVNLLGTPFSGSVPAYSPAPTISSVAISGGLATPTVTVTGSGFGAEDDLGSPVPAYCGNTGFDYDNNLYLLDGWGAGQGSGPFGDCTGVSITSYSNTRVTFTFGSGYGTGNNQYGVLSSGDSFQMNVLGTTFNGTVPYPASPTIGGVTFGGDPGQPDGHRVGVRIRHLGRPRHARQPPVAADRALTTATTSTSPTPPARGRPDRAPTAWGWSSRRTRAPRSCSPSVTSTPCSARWPTATVSR